MNDPGNNPLVLVVEDYQDAREMYAAYLQFSGYRVAEATNGVEAAIGRIEKAGGKVAHGPMEVPGGAFIAVAQDPQGAWFAVVGPKQAS